MRAAAVFRDCVYHHMYVGTPVRALIRSQRANAKGQGPGDAERGERERGKETESLDSSVACRCDHLIVRSHKCVIHGPTSTRMSGRGYGGYTGNSESDTAEDWHRLALTRGTPMTTPVDEAKTMTRPVLVPDQNCLFPRSAYWCPDLQRFEWWRMTYFRTTSTPNGGQGPDPIAACLGERTGPCEVTEREMGEVT